jgi:S1-C subfamily serine protease
MQRFLATLILAGAMPLAMAAEPAADASADAAAAAAAPASAAGAATTDPEAARRELAELRNQMQALSRRMANLSLQLGDAGPRAYAFRYLGDPDRAMVGVVLGSDEDGVRISAVTPDGPAARAGLQGGDVLVAINGQRIDGRDAASALAEARRLLADLDEGDKVRVGWKRDGKAQRDVVLAAQRREAWNWPRLLGDEHAFSEEDYRRVRSEAERASQRALREQDRARVVVSTDRRKWVDAQRARASAVERANVALRMTPWWGLNLAPVNAGLGRYFGTDKGALVIAGNDDALPGLRAGDVIVAIDGEPVERPEDALRALRDQEPGDSVKVGILRDHRKQSLDLKVPAFHSIFAMPPGMPAPPAPPAPPEPPAGPGATAPAMAPPPPAPPASPGEPAPPAPPAAPGEPVPPAPPVA